MESIKVIANLSTGSHTKPIEYESPSSSLRFKLPVVTPSILLMPYELHKQHQFDQSHQMHNIDR